MSRPKRVVLALSVLASCLLFACQDVTTSLYSPELASPQSDTFSFDVALLSEWQGAYEPIEITQSFCLKQNDYFRQITSNYIKYKLNNNNHSDDKRTVTIDLNYTEGSNETYEPFNVNCYFSTKNVQEKYGLERNCIGQLDELPTDASTTTAELQYYCALNLNISNLSHLNTDWAAVFPDAFNSNSGTIQIDNVPVCAYFSTDADGNEIFNVRPNAPINTIPITEFDKITKITGDDTFEFSLFNRNSYASSDYYEVKCSKHADAVADDSCIFDDEIQYDCYTYLGGATGLNHVWKDMFKRENTPLFIAGNGDNFGASQPNSREFNDHPTVQLLSALGFSADTFGNHVFEKDISVLNDMLEESSYPHVISNLSNVPQNLPELAPYTIWQVPANDSECSPQDAGTCCRSDDNPNGVDCLGVGVVSAIDASLMYFIQPGKFGSLQTTDYCAVLYSLQRAYNNNARAFMILSHVSTESDFMTTEYPYANGVDFTNSTELNNSNNYNQRVSVFKLLQVLFSLKSPENSVCPETHLILPTSRIDQKNKLCPSICMKDADACTSICNSACTESGCDESKLIKSVANELNLEIFNGIIGIFTAQGDQHMVGFASKDENNNYPGLVSFDIVKADTQDPYYFENNYYKTQNLFGSNRALSSSDTSSEPLTDLFDAHPLTVNQNVLNKANAKTHPIWVIQVPGGGSTTAKLEVTVSRDETPNDRGNLAQPYTAAITNAYIVPTFHTPEDVDIPKPNTCIDNIESLIMSDPNIKNVSKNQLKSKCYSLRNSDASDDLAQACSCYNYYLEAQNYLVAASDNTETPSYKDCQNYLAQRAIQHTNRSIDPASLQNIWNCLYYTKDYAMCSADNAYWDPNQYSTDASSNENDLNFKEITFFDFEKIDLTQNIDNFLKHIRNITEKEIRRQTTFITSWVTEILLSAFNGSEARFDGLLLNVGSFNRIQDVNRTSYTKSALRNIITYANSFMSVTLSPSSFVNYITNAISTTNASRGQYPVFAGFMLSTIDPDGMPTQIAELWSVHQPYEFCPYNSNDDSSAHCIPRNANNILKDPLYQLIDLVELDDNINCDVAFEKARDNSDSPSAFKKLSELNDNVFVTPDKGIFLFTPDNNFDKYQTVSGFTNYFDLHYQDSAYTISNNMCKTANNGHFYNVYYPGSNKSSGSDSIKLHPMLLHVSQEELSSSGNTKTVCKCYLTAVEEGIGYKTSGEINYYVANASTEKNTNSEEDIKDKELNLAVVYYIATGGDGYKLPNYVTPTAKTTIPAKFDLISPDAYLPSGTYQTTIDILENYFTSPQNETKDICTGLTSNPKLIDGRSDEDFVWDNSFYRHIHVNTAGTQNQFIMNIMGSMNSFRPEYVNGITR